jgi:hypothetical protein
MKKLSAIALAGALLSGLGLIQPGVSSAATLCAGPMGPGVISGALTVAGGDCVLAPGTTVTGSVKLSSGTLTMTDATVRGSLTQTGGTLVAQNSTIRGSVKVTGVDNMSRNDICGGTIGGSVTVSNVGGSPFGWFRLLGTDAFAPVTPCTAPFTALRVEGSVNFTNNNVYVRVSRARVDGSVKLTNNKSNVYDPPNPNSGDVSFNTIGGSLKCDGNNPDPSGSGNVVSGSKKGECAAF